MSYHAPKVSDVVQKTPDPLINLGDTSAAVRNQRNKRGMLSTFMDRSAAASRSAGFLAGLANNKSSTLGNQPTD